MSTPRWQPGRLYPPGSLVVPRTSPAPGTIAPIPNFDFEDGDLSGWTVLSGNFYVTDAEQGAYSGQYELVTRTEPENSIVSAFKADVRPGEQVTAQCYVKPTRGSDRGTVRIYWYDDDDNPVSPAYSEIPHGQSGHIEGTGGWRLSRLTTQVPLAARKMAVGFWCRKYTGSYFGVDRFSWTYPTFQPQEGLLYKAVQPASGYSDTDEPAWPGVLGQQVIDNEVIWEAVSISRVVWQARPILKSGPTEPDWPTGAGDLVADNTISWEAVSRRVEDERCPQSKVVVIAASKVFAGDDDIIAYSATVNPLDWSSPDNAGYLPFGLQLYGANPVAAMGLYRGNVVAFNAQGAQVWQVDEDPALMALLDAFPVGSQHHHALAPVTNDLFILTQLGVRTVGVAGGSTNLQAGDVGLPIDEMVQAALDAAESDPVGLYNPNAGQYWLLFREQPEEGQTLGFVYTMNRLGKIGAWTRYVFPFAIDDWCILGNDLCLRHGSVVSKVSAERESDEIVVGGVPTRQAFEWTVQWPWLDFGQLGVTKMMQGFDIIGTGECRIQFGYDQTDGGRWTPEWQLIADSVPGQLLPMPLAAPSLAVRLIYQGSDDNRTSWDALNVHLSPFRSTA